MKFPLVMDWNYILTWFVQVPYRLNYFLQWSSCR